MKPTLSNNLDIVDELIRKGDLAGARKKLKRLAPSQVPREKFATLANLLRRSGLIDRGLRLLSEIVRSESKLIVATPEERLEYAMLLVRKGAIHEARELLQSVDSEVYPDALLYEIFTLIPEWRYAETIPILTKYIERIPERPLQQLVGQVNLVAAYIFCEEHEKLSTLLPTAIANAKKYEYNFLLGSLYELGAQFEIAREDFKKAEEYLSLAQTLLGATETQESFYVHKWRTIMGLLKRPEPLHAVKALRELQEAAKSRADWETVRDCDFHLLRFAGTQSLFDRLYSGSPNPSYRKRLESMYPKFKVPAARYEWHLSGVPQTTRRYIHVHEGKTGDGQLFTDVGQAPHKLLVLLSRDFYRPQRLMQLATEIFVGEYVHPIHTPDKMHQIIARLRSDLKKSKLPLKVKSKGQAVWLEGIRNCTIVKDWSKDHLDVDATRLHILQLNGLFKKTFSTKEAARVWDCSVATASRRLHLAVDKSMCVKVGAGRTTQFQLLQNETAA